MRSSAENPAAPARAMSSPTSWSSCRCRSASSGSHRARRDEGADALLGAEHAADLELPVGADDGVRVDGEVHGELADGGELVAAA